MRALLFILFISVIYCSNGQNPIGQSYFELDNHNSGKKTEFNYTYKVSLLNNGTWFYDVLRNNKLFIHQTSIPGLSGNKGFRTKSDAKKVVQLVIEKLIKGEIPPTVTNDELNELNIYINN